MALFGTQRDVSLFRHMSRELMGDVISEQCAYYKYKLEETKINLYGEAAHEKFYMGPVLLNCLIERTDNVYPETDLGTDYDKEIQFSFLRDDLLNKQQDFNGKGMSYRDTTVEYGADLVPDVGDIIMYNEGYYEVHDVIANQYFVGKNPDYPNNENPINAPLNGDLSNYGSNISIICKSHYVQADKLGLTQARYI
jgi:signal peptidase I|tara:strand:- start:4370 stop:4954 length:585 start_codon:yes stop_codon:yes gene_type:complete